MKKIERFPEWKAKIKIFIFLPFDAGFIPCVFFFVLSSLPAY